MESNVTVSNENTKENILNRENVLLLIGSLMLGVLFDILFYGKPLGVSYPIFILAFYVIMLWNSRKLIVFELNFGWFLSIPILMLSFAFFIFSNPMFQVLNFIAVPALIVSQTLLITKNNKYKWYTTRFLDEIFQSVFLKSLEHVFKPFKLIFDWITKKIEGKYAVVSKVLIGLAISIPLMLVVVVLLSSADQIFAQFSNSIFNLFSNIKIDELIFRVAVVLFVSVVLFSYMWSLIYPIINNESVDKEKPLNRILDPIIVVTVLFSINIIYLLFVFIQFTYLFGGADFALPPDFTHSDYARRGFFELLTVTLINLSVLLCCINFTKDSGKAISKLVRILNSMMVVSTLVMLYSAHFRMSLYEEAYGYTYLRVLTHAFMAYIFVLLTVALFRIWNQRTSLVKWYIMISILAYIIVNYSNIDAIISKNNINRYHEYERIDVSYLSSLSPDAVPFAIELFKDKNKNIAIEVENYLYKQKEKLTKKNFWQSFNISEYRAKNILDKYNLRYHEDEVNDMSDKIEKLRSIDETGY